jgi:hypothetical protein
VDSLTTAERTTVNHFACSLLLAKLHFVCGDAEAAGHELLRVQQFPEIVLRALRDMAPHWAFAVFLSSLLQAGVPPPPAARHPALYIIGDSHCLPPAWHDATPMPSPRSFHPRLVMGLKAWHLRDGLRFVTVANLHRHFRLLPPYQTHTLQSDSLQSG